MRINVHREATQFGNFFDDLPHPLCGQPAPMSRQKNLAAGTPAD